MKTTGKEKQKERRLVKGEISQVSGSKLQKVKKTLIRLTEEQLHEKKSGGVVKGKWNNQK